MPSCGRTTVIDAEQKHVQSSGNTQQPDRSQTYTTISDFGQLRISEEKEALLCVSAVKCIQNLK